MPVDLISQGKEHNYDKGKYRDMLLEAAETVLGYLGFDGTVYRDSIQKKNREWWYEFREEPRNDIQTERCSRWNHSTGYIKKTKNFG